MDGTWADNPPAQSEASLAAAFETRTRQLYEARGALGEAVAILRAELSPRRSEANVLQSETRALQGETKGLQAEAANLRGALDQTQLRIARLEAQLAEAYELISIQRNMRVVRWTAPARRVLHRLFDRDR